MFCYKFDCLWLIVLVTLFFFSFVLLCLIICFSVCCLYWFVYGFGVGYLFSLLCCLMLAVVYDCAGCLLVICVLDLFTLDWFVLFWVLGYVWFSLLFGVICSVYLLFRLIVVVWFFLYLIFCLCLCLRLFSLFWCVGLVLLLRFLRWVNWLVWWFAILLVACELLWLCVLFGFGMCV